MTACTICPRTLTPAEDREGLYACRACVDQVRAWLAELPGQVAELQECLELGPPGSGRIGGTGRAHSPIPVRLDALDLLGAGAPVPVEDPHGDQTGGIPIMPILHGWAWHIAREFGTGDGPGLRSGGTVPGWCAWLTAYLPYAATRPWILALYEEIADLLHRVRQITALTPRRHPMDAPCPECQTFALARIDGERYIKCEVCPQLLTHDEYLDHRGRVMPALARVALLMVAAQAQATSGV